jgi:4-amino-4-deoxy-L-arabinose transferase-like glycosyltransferase
MVHEGAKGTRGAGIRGSEITSKVLILASTLVIGLFYFWGVSTLPFLDPDEGMTAEIAREMLASGDWIVPRFNGVVYIEKPPLMYWLTAASYAVAGASEFSARLWKVAPMLGTIALTVGLGRRLFSRRVGGLSGLILATTLGTFLFSRITQMDPLFVFGSTLAVTGIVDSSKALENGPQGGTSYGGLWFWLGVGIAVMSKGLLGIVFPLALLGLWILLRRDVHVVRGGWSWIGVLLAALLIVPWHVAAVMKVPGFVQFYLMDNQLLRFLGERAYVEDGKSLGTIPFFGITFFALFPWAPFLVAALVCVWRETWRTRSSMRPGRFAIGFGDACMPVTPGNSRSTFHDPHIHFLVGWLLLVVGFFAVSSFKLEYYALPAFPAVALLIAALIVCAGRWQDRDSSSATGGLGDTDLGPHVAFALLRSWCWVGLIGGLLVLAAVMWAWWAGGFTSLNIVRGLSIWSTSYRVLLEQSLPLPSVSPTYYEVVLVGGGLLWVMGFAVAVFALRGSRVLIAAGALALVGLGLVALANSVLLEIGPQHSLKPLAARLNRLLRPEDILIHERGLERGGGLLFYTGRRVLVLNGTRGDLEFGSKFPESRQAFIGSRMFLDLWGGSGRVYLVTDVPPERSAVSLLPNPHPAAIASTGTRWLYANHPPASAAPAHGSPTPLGAR